MRSKLYVDTLGVAAVLGYSLADAHALARQEERRVRREADRVAGTSVHTAVVECGRCGRELEVDYEIVPGEPHVGLPAPTINLLSPDECWICGARMREWFEEQIEEQLS